jgi:hypothetical protein
MYLMMAKDDFCVALAGVLAVFWFSSLRMIVDSMD